VRRSILKYIIIYIYRDGRIPGMQETIQLLDNEHIHVCFKTTMAVIDHAFLKQIPQGSRFGSVQHFLFNLVSFAIRMHLEVERMKITKDQATAYIYELDMYTDFDAWVPPISRFVGPAGARNFRKTEPLPARAFQFIGDDGVAFELEMGD